MAAESSSGSEQLVDQVVDLKRTLGQFARLVEISLTLNSSLDQDKILQNIISTASTVMNCEAVSILLYDEKRERLFIAASTDANPEELAKIPVPIDNSIAGTIFTTNSPEIINNLENDPRHFEEVGEKVDFKIDTLVGVPMTIRDKVTGVLEGLNKHDGAFTREDIDILSVIASQAAVAINNARMMQELQDAYDELAEIDKIKSEFISIASHELRTPLFHILGYAEMLSDETEGESSDSAKRLLQSALQLQTLVDDMTNMDLLEMAAQDITMEKVAVQQIIVDAYKSVVGALKAKNHEASFNLPQAPIHIKAEKEKMERAVVNVLNNAVRFTPPGGHIIVSLKEDKEHAHLSISDNGIGIPPDELEKIFDRFYQVDSHLTRSEGGMGLGLSIARGLVQAHGGRMWAESEGESKGTTVQIRLPKA